MKKLVLFATLIFFGAIMVSCSGGTGTSEAETTITQVSTNEEVTEEITTIAEEPTSVNPTSDESTTIEEVTDKTTASESNHIISFNTNGGNQLDEIEIANGEYLQEPDAPIRDGYKFLGWFIDSSLSTPVQWSLEISSNITLYAGWNEEVPYGDYLSALLLGVTTDPYSYIPDSMIPGSRLITSEQMTDDYTSFVNTSSLAYGGYGEQWQMVSTNLAQSEAFFNVLTVVDSLSSVSITAFNNYLDSNPSDKANYDFVDGIYQVTISFEAGVIYYVLDYTKTLPVFGEQTVQIALSQNIFSGEKIGRVQIGDANALKYVVTENSYEFAIKYAGVRRAYFSISKDDEDNVEGQIFEYLGIDGSYSMGSAAQFFIDDEYISVVGNKSSSMMGWTGTIVELYDIESGQLLGYEVQETLSSITYNTLWFNLADTSGILTIKFEDAPIEDSNPYLVYINGSGDVFMSKNVRGFSLRTQSRRYDIELRDQYFYYMDGENLVVENTLVPMIFVQEEQIDTLVSDINSENSNLTFGLNVTQVVIDKIKDNYSTLIEPFNLQKGEVTAESIVEYIGDSYSHD
jgi:uncharacterized repeat protein (TIGR02543 family)